MPGSAETIKSFLVSLGWKVDTAGMNRFASSIAIQTEAVRELGEAIKGIASRIIDYVRDVAEGMDKLYFASQRTKSSADNLNSLSYAMEQMGLSGDTATKSIENLREWLFKNPGGESILHSLGVQTRDAKGNMRDLSDVWRETMKKLATLPPGLAATYSQMFGTDFQTMLAAGSGKLDEFRQQYLAMLKSMGLSEQQAAETSNQFMSRLRLIGAEVKILSEKVGSEILSKALPYFDQFITYVVTHMPEIEAAINQFLTACKPIAAAVLNMARVAIQAIMDLVRWWNNLGETGRKVITWIVGIAAAVVALVAGLTALGVVVAAVSTAFEFIAAVAGVVATAIGAISIPALIVAGVIAALVAVCYHFRDAQISLGGKTYELRDIFSAVWTGIVKMFSWVGSEFMKLVHLLTRLWGGFVDFIGNLPFVQKIIGAFESLMKWVGRLFSRIGAGAPKWLTDALDQAKDEREKTEGKTKKPAPKSASAATSTQESAQTQAAGRADQTQAVPSANASQPRGIRNNNPGNINYGEFARSQGATGVEAAGRFATFATAQEGLNALGSLLRSYAARGIDTIRSIISKYAPKGENNTESYIASVTKRLGFGADTHLNLSDPKVLAGLEQAIVRMENGKNPYSADMYTLSANRATGPAGASGVQIAQTNTITIHGASNPHETEKAIGNAMQTSNQQLQRSMQGRIS